MFLIIIIIITVLLLSPGLMKSEAVVALPLLFLVRFVCKRFIFYLPASGLFWIVCPGLQDNQTKREDLISDKTTESWLSVSLLLHANQRRLHTNQRQTHSNQAPEPSNYSCHPLLLTRATTSLPQLIEAQNSGAEFCLSKRLHTCLGSAGHAPWGTIAVWARALSFVPPLVGF